MPSEQLMRTPLVAPILAWVEEIGGDPQALLTRFGLTESARTDPEITLPLSQIQAFYDAAEVALGEPFMGMKLAGRLDRGVYGLVEFAMRSAPNVADAIRRMVRYIALLNDLAQVTFTETDSEGLIEQRIVGSPLCMGRHGNEFFVAVIVLRVRDLTDDPCLAQHAWFAHPRPPDTGLLEEMLGTTDIRFGAEANGVALSRATLSASLKSADPALLQVLDQQAELALKARQVPRHFVGQVREAIRTSLRDGPPALDAVARALSMSPRTLQRRIAGEDTTFQRLVEEVREELARLYLGDAARPLADVAFALGYAEMTAFLRAFKRWTGLTPTQFRQRGST